MGHDGGVTQPHRPACLDAAGVIGAWMHDLTGNRVVADPGVAGLFGLACCDRVNGDPLGHYLDAVHPADRAGCTSAIEAASRCGRSIALQDRIRTSAGARRVRGYGSFSLDASGRSWRGQGIVIDATLARRGAGTVEEVAACLPRDRRLRSHIDLLAEHVIPASGIVRTLPSAKLRTLTDSWLWEVERLSAWVTSERA